MSAPTDPHARLLRKLLDLSAVDELEPLLEAALDLIVEMSGATQAALELWASPDPDAPRWRLHRGLSAEGWTALRALSRSVIAEAVCTGQPVQSASALDDPRFAGQASVVEQRIEAVLCVPIGRPAVGVVYLQGRAQPGPFLEEDLDRASLFARQLAPLADRLLLRRERQESADPTLPWRKRLGAVPLVGRSRALAELLRQVALAAPLDIDVLITGPSGSGKSAVAELVAASSLRARRPFVALNCAALPSELVESELFGAERGAHSTAHRAMTGKVEAAQGGTLFLDEVAELPLSAQAKLLQLLQARQFWPLGSSRPRSADIRVIAATHADLDQLVRERRFRDDLRYRLTVFAVRCPGLDERVVDIPLLAESFAAAAAQRHRLPPIPLSAAGMAALAGAPWPGHVRQLAHAVEAALVRAWGEAAAFIGPEHLFPQLPAPEPVDLDLHRATAAFQRRLVLEALTACEWNVSQAARRLGLARSHLYTLMGDLDLRRPDRSGAPSGRAAR